MATDPPEESTPGDEEEGEIIDWQVAAIELLAEWNENGFPMVVMFDDEDDGYKKLLGAVANGAHQLKRCADALEAIWASQKQKKS